MTALTDLQTLVAETFASTATGDLGFGVTSQLTALKAASVSDPDTFFRSSRSTGTEAAQRLRGSLQSLKFRILSASGLSATEEASRLSLAAAIEARIQEAEKLVRLR